jgi:CRISPR-associated protein Csb2
VISVPNNDLDVWTRPLAAGRQPKKLPADLRTMKAVRPTALGDGPDDGGAAVHFLWPLTDADVPEGGYCENLAGLARRVIALGWGTDLVAASARLLDDAEVPRLSGVCWRAVDRSDNTRSHRALPVSGTLDALRVRHARFLSRVDAARKHYDHVRPYVELEDGNAPRRLVTYVREGSIPRRPRAVFQLQDSQGKFCAFRQQDAVLVAAMVRHRACETAKRDSHEFPGGSEIYVAGHTKVDPALKIGPTPPRFSYLPLPSIGDRHADGVIRRVLIAEPLGGDGSHANWAQIRLHNATLVDQDQCERAVMVQPDRADGVLTSYVGTGRSWSTVTPVVLPGYDDGKHTKAERLFLAALRQAGLPLETVEDVTLRKAPFWPGSEHPHLYRRPTYLKGLPSWHVHVRFREEVSGPLAIGAGRHCGLGIFAVWME